MHNRKNGIIHYVLTFKQWGASLAQTVIQLQLSFILLTLSIMLLKKKKG